MPLTTIKTKFQVTIPAEIVKALHLSIGDLLEATAERGKIVLTPKMLVDRKPAKKK
jgi:AbrB family looped-hinge helix DNA binding protein